MGPKELERRTSKVGVLILHGHANQLTYHLLYLLSRGWWVVGGRGVRHVRYYIKVWALYALPTNVGTQ